MVYLLTVILNVSVISYIVNALYFDNIVHVCVPPYSLFNSSLFLTNANGNYYNVVHLIPNFTRLSRYRVELNNLILKPLRLLSIKFNNLKLAFVFLSI